MEIRNAIQRLLERLPDLELVPGTVPTRFPSAIVNGLVHMPTVIEPISDRRTREANAGARVSRFIVQLASISLVR